MDNSSAQTLSDPEAQPLCQRKPRPGRALRQCKPIGRRPLHTGRLGCKCRSFDLGRWELRVHPYRLKTPGVSPSPPCRGPRVTWPFMHGPTARQGWTQHWPLGPDHGCSPPHVVGVPPSTLTGTLPSPAADRVRQGSRGPGRSKTQGGGRAAPPGRLPTGSGHPESTRRAARSHFLQTRPRAHPLPSLARRGLRHSIRFVLTAFHGGGT